MALEMKSVRLQKLQDEVIVAANGLSEVKKAAAHANQATLARVIGNAQETLFAQARRLDEAVGAALRTERIGV